MKKALLLSVIIPVYNKEKYLGDCINSILKQVVRGNYEIILVDDGSYDSSGKMCDQLAMIHPEIRVIHKVNGGVSSARNAGLRIATGEYVLFVDADDFLLPESLKVISKLFHNNPDICIFGRAKQDDLGNLESLQSAENIPQGESGIEWLGNLKNYIIFATIGGAAFRNAFLREQDLQFREDLPVAEDTDFGLRAIMRAERIIGTNEIVYIYRYVENSLWHTLNFEKLFKSLQNCVEHFREYPSALMAHMFIGTVLRITALDNKTEQRDLEEYIFSNRDIFAYATNLHLRIACAFMKIFGYARGASISWRLHRARRILQRGNWRNNATMAQKCSKRCCKDVKF